MEDVEDEDEYTAWGDVKGGWLNVTDVDVARREGVCYMKCLLVKTFFLNQTSSDSQCAS